MDFPPYRRSHLRSNTYRALVHLLTHLSAYNASVEPSTQPLTTPDNGNGRMDQENQEKEPKCSEVVDSDCLDPKDPICKKDTQEVQETIEGVGDKDTDFTFNKMVLDDIEQMMGIEDMSTEANCFDKEQKLMNEFELIMKGTEDLISDNDLIPLNLGLDEKHNDAGEVELMDCPVEIEEGEISGDLEIDGNSFDVSSADALILQQMEVDEVQKPENVTGSMKNPSKTGKQEKEKGYDSNSSTVKALQDANKTGQVEPRTSDKKGIACGVEVAISKETIECQKEDKTKKANRKKRAQKNKQLGVKRLQLQHVQRPKVVSHCRHYLNGRCHEGGKCQFSHDTVPLTKSKPCTHFARHSCMKGDDCPFDHQLSKYPCTNFVSKGSCYRGAACMFSHQVPTKEDIRTPSSVCRPELSPLLSGNANSSTPFNNNHGSSSAQKNHNTNSAGIHSCINVEHKETNTVQKQPTPPKGISFINLAQSSSSPSSLNQGAVTTKKNPAVQIGFCEDQSAFHKTQNKVEVPKKLPAMTPKGINFLSFGKGSVCSFKSSIPSNVNRENGIKLPQLFNFGLPEPAHSSLNKDGYNKASDRTKQNVPQTDIFLNEILGKNQSVAEEMKSKLPERTSVDIFVRDHSLSKSLKEGKKALLSTLAFAAEHESDIKMKYPTGSLPV